MDRVWIEILSRKVDQKKSQSVIAIGNKSYKFSAALRIFSLVKQSSWRCNWKALSGASLHILHLLMSIVSPRPAAYLTMHGHGKLHPTILKSYNASNFDNRPSNCYRCGFWPPEAAQNVARANILRDSLARARLWSDTYFMVSGKKPSAKSRWSKSRYQ
jgi:hypothetical protein